MTVKLKLTSGDVCKVAGIPMNTLDRWLAGGLLGPAHCGRGKGRHRTYSIVETLAVAAGARWRAEGADPDRVAGIVRFVAGLSVERLEDELKAGRTFAIPVVMLGPLELPGVGGVLIEPPVDPDMSPNVRELIGKLDLGRCWADVRRQVAELVDCLGGRRRKAGRLRGLAGACKGET